MHSSVDSVAHYKEIPSGASESIVWDRCNYSDNIREPALPAVSSPRLEEGGSGWGMQLFYSVLHVFTPPHTHFLTSVSLYINSFIVLSPPRTHAHTFTPFRVVCKAEFVPVGCQPNKGNHTVTVQLLIVPPHPSVFTNSQP